MSREAVSRNMPSIVRRDIRAYSIHVTSWTPTESFMTLPTLVEVGSPFGIGVFVIEISYKFSEIASCYMHNINLSGRETIESLSKWLHKIIILIFSYNMLPTEGEYLYHHKIAKEDFKTASEDWTVSNLENSSNNSTKFKKNYTSEISKLFLLNLWGSPISRLKSFFRTMLVRWSIAAIPRILRRIKTENYLH